VKKRVAGDKEKKTCVRILSLFGEEAPYFREGGGEDLKSEELLVGELEGSNRGKEKQGIDLERSQSSTFETQQGEERKEFLKLARRVKKTAPTTLRSRQLLEVRGEGDLRFLPQNQRNEGKVEGSCLNTPILNRRKRRDNPAEGKRGGSAF